MEPSVLNHTYTADSDDEVFQGPVTSKELAKVAKMKRRTQVLIPFMDSGIGKTLGERKESDEGEEIKVTSHPTKESPDKYKFEMDSLDDEFGGKKLPNEVPIEVEEDSLDENNKTHEITGENLLQDQHVHCGEEKPGELNVTYSFQSENMQAGADHNIATHQPDEDGGYLSILSEAAIYHASLDSNSQSHQSVDNSEEHAHSQQSLDSLEELACPQEEQLLGDAESYSKFQKSQHALEKRSLSKQPLGDRYREFGVSEHDLEDQELTESIMYTTRRESTLFADVLPGHSPSSSQKSNFLYSKCKDQALQSPSGDQAVQPRIQQKIFNLDRIEEKSVCSVGCEIVDSSNDVPDCLPSVVTPKYVSTDSNTEDLKNIHREIGSEVCTLIDPLALADAPEVAANEDLEIHDVSSSDETEVQNVSSSAVASTVGNNDDISGVWAREDFTEGDSDTSFNEQKDLSTASSSSERMNDTLEEYEMLMRYGVDYILGKKGNSKKTKDIDNALDSNMVNKSENPQATVDSSSSYHEAQAECQQQDAPQCSDVENKRTDMKGTAMVQKVENSTLLKLGTPLRRVCGQRNTPVSSPQVPSSKMKGLQGYIPTKNVITKPASSQLNTGIPLPRVAHVPLPQHYHTPSPQRTLQPPSQGATGSFKKPIKPVSSSRLPRMHGSNIPTSAGHVRPTSKSLDKIQSPVSAYIHNTPSPILVKNIKAKSTELGSIEKERHVRAVWRTHEAGLTTTPKVSNQENISPNASCGLPSVTYMRAPCIKVDEKSKAFTMPRVGEKMDKLLDSPCPQVIKHEGRLKVDCRSPQYAAVAQAVHRNADDSMYSLQNPSGDISVCVSKTASRSNTLGRMSPSTHLKYLN